MRILTGKQKAAIFLSTLDTDIAAQIIKGFNEFEIAQISAEVKNLEKFAIDESTTGAVLDEFLEKSNSNPTFNADFANSFRMLLEQTLGKKKTEEILSSISKKDYNLVPFEALKELDIDALFNILSTEHPQTIALTLSYLEASQAADVLAKFPVELQADVLTRIASMVSPSTKLLLQVNEYMESKAQRADNSCRKVSNDQRLKTVIEIVGKADMNTEKAILDIIAQKEPEIADEIKKLSFVFEDLTLVQDQALMKVLSELGTQVIALGLKTASEDVVKKIFGNLSQRVGQNVKDELEMMGLKPLSEVEEAQQQIVDAIKAIEASGERVITRKGSTAEQLV